MSSDQAFFNEQDCRFCRVGAGLANNSHDRVLMESDDYFAIASIGGFIEGWTLVCAKRHVLNLAEDYTRPAFSDFVADVADVVSAAYGHVVAFEHGVRHRGSLTGCGTDHAHLHIVPFDGDFSRYVIAERPRVEWEMGPALDIARLSGGADYLLMADSIHELKSELFVSRVRNPESQFFRKLLAKRMGVEEQFDYRRFPFAETTERSVHRLAEVAESRFLADAS